MNDLYILTVDVPMFHMSTSPAYVLEAGTIIEAAWWDGSRGGGFSGRISMHNRVAVDNKCSQLFAMNTRFCVRYFPNCWQRPDRNYLLNDNRFTL